MLVELTLDSSHASLIQYQKRHHSLGSASLVTGNYSDLFVLEEIQEYHSARINTHTGPLDFVTQM